MRKSSGPQSRRAHNPYQLEFQLYQVPDAEIRVQAVYPVREPGPLPNCHQPEDLAGYWRERITRSSWYDREREALVKAACG